MAETIANEFRKYFEALTATSAIATEFGSTFTLGGNLFIGVEPTATQCICCIPYGGAPPNIDKQRHESAVQIVVKTKGRRKAMNTTQSVINELHGHDFCGSQQGKVYAQQSSPILLGAREGGEYILAVSNFYIKHIKE